MDGFINNTRAIPAKPIQNEPVTIQNKNTSAPAGSFKSAMENAISRQQTVLFSKHANMRLNTRQITLTDEQLSRIEEGVNRANAKGIRDSLVMVDDVMLVVNVRSKTVVTAVNREQENVFNNIDGAVIV